MQPFIDELGIGLACFPGTETVVQSLSGYIDLVEIEHPTSWFLRSPESDSFQKTLHGTDSPLGGALLPTKEYFDLLKTHICAVEPVYTSELLGFHRYCNMEGLIDQVDCLLPLLQNQHGIETAFRAISYYKKQTGLPFAFGTGINYLQCRTGEMEDGEFIARIAEESDAYILLDLHNLLTNQQNGRQPVKDLLQQLPAERIIELRINSPEHLPLADAIVPDLPCLKSFVYDMLPEYPLQELTVNSIRKQLVAMKRIWDRRNTSTKAQRLQKRIKSEKPVDNSLIPEVWEYVLGSMTNNSVDEDIPLQHELLQDPGLAFIKEHRTYQKRTVSGMMPL